MKETTYIMLAFVGLVLGVASPLPIWPGPLLVRHLPPGIISLVLIILACFRAMKEGSRTVGVIAIIYGAIATSGSVGLILLIVRATSLEFLAEMRGIMAAGSIFVLATGLVVTILGYKTFKAAAKISTK